jgi:hypothetical protein
MLSTIGAMKEVFAETGEKREPERKEKPSAPRELSD